MSIEEQIEQAAEIVKQGGIVIYPTDTAFGIGCRIDNDEAIKKLFTLRRRPMMQSAPVLVASKAIAQEYLLPIPEKVEILMDTYWPGALTIRWNYKKDKDQLGGMRMPNHPTALALIEKIGVPILGPSANFHGEPTPFRFEDLNPELTKLVDVVLPGECKVKESSTVVDCRVEPWHIIRQGAVKL